MDDLAKVQAMFYWKSHGSAAVNGIRDGEIPPEVTEKIYNALVRLGADPLPRDACILECSLVDGHLNVTRAIAAAGVDILGTFDFDDIYLFSDWLLSEGVRQGQTRCVQFLLTSGADIRSVTHDDVCIAALEGSFEVLELLLDMGLEAFPEATDALCTVLPSPYIAAGDVLPTIQVLIRGGANIADVELDMEKALRLEWWDVVEFLFGAEELSSELGEEYALIQGVLEGDQTRVREQIEAGEDINAFRSAALRLAIVKGKEDIVKLLLDCGANPGDSIWQVFEFIDAQKKMGVAQPSLAILSLLLDAGANPGYLMIKKSMEPAYVAMFEEFLPLCQQEDLNNLLTTAWKDGNSKDVQTLLAA
ncbi:hypothetical protein HK104_002911, partial [Borealophlyctis nickersoniae]